ncbi:MAG TPA: glutamyl-tRNA reductase, partial [bacterium]|nr:glutamyl-tRNA reductase [bacterium]
MSTQACEYVVVGLNHRMAPVAQRERFAVDPAALPAALGAMRGAGVEEAVLLSTCNRVEWYLAGREPAAVVSAASAFFGDGVAVRAQLGPDAVRHVFRVAGGLDSRIVGESQILGQVRAAFAAGRGAGTVGPCLDALFRAALAAGRRARRETDIVGGAASVPSAAVAHAVRLLGSLGGSRVLVIGAGKMGEATARAMGEAGARAVVVANRTVEAAREIAAPFAGEVVPLHRVGAELARADVAIVGTGAPGVILDAAAVAAACRARATALVLIDIAVPRNVDPAAGRLPGVHLYDIDDLIAIPGEQGIGTAGMQHAEALIEDDVQRFLRERAGRDAASLIAEARADADTILAREWDRARARLAALSADEEAAVRAVLHRVVNKLLHRPIAALVAAA